jgi:hypothetical protein
LKKMASPAQPVPTKPTKLSPQKLDSMAERREELKLEIELINQCFSQQIEHYGFTPPRAEKSKRLAGETWQMTLSYGETTEIRDAAVEVIKKVCSLGLFAKLFREVRQYKVASTAAAVLMGTLPEGAPPNLRKLWLNAVVHKAKAPALRVERLNGDQ